jgi:hypothetical protein
MSNNLRAHNRYAVRAAVFFSWRDLPSGQPKHRRGEGLTRDISPGGLFVWSSEAPPAGMQVQVEVLLPKIDDVAQPLRFEGSGYVTRVEYSPGNPQDIGFALCGEKLFLQAMEEQLRAEDED